MEELLGARNGGRVGAPLISVCSPAWKLWGPVLFGFYENLVT